MKDRDGFTLIEIIVSLAILGIISVSFLMAMANHFTFLVKSNEIAQNEFLLQSSMEEKIESIKNEIKSGNIIDYENINIFDNLITGGMVVEYVEAIIPIESDEYFAYVAKMQPDDLTVLELESVYNNIYYDDEKLPYGYFTDEFKIKGNFTNKSDYKKFVFLSTVEWYIASKEYIMPVRDKSQITENPGYYPSWPNDYTLIKTGFIEGFGNPHRTELAKTSDYLGRHVILTVTPGAKSGKLGKQMTSELPLFISGIPKVDDLIMHFDANFINSSSRYNDEINIENNTVEKWLDLSSIIRNDSFNEFAYPIGEKPVLVKTELGESFLGQYVRFNNNQSMKINSTNTEDVHIYVYAVVRKRDEIGESIFLINGEETMSVGEDDFDDDGSWFLISKDFTSIIAEFIIGGSNIDIAEIAIFDKPLSEDNLIYFKDKYSLPIIIDNP